MVSKNMGIVQKAVAWQNKQWAVMCSVDVRCKGHYYWVEGHRLLESHAGTYEWPMHMAEKEWVDPAAFVEAWKKAIEVRGMRADDRLMRATMTEMKPIVREMEEERRFSRWCDNRGITSYCAGEEFDRLWREFKRSDVVRK
jgi:hypothetical protein